MRIQLVYIITILIMRIIFSSLANGNTIKIPEHYATIQEGIDASSDGDTVLIADGTYAGIGNRDIEFLGKAITVSSENGPATTVIDCESRGRGFHISYNESRETRLEGVSICNAYSASSGGGGIVLYWASSTIFNCWIYNNYAWGGGGILCLFEAPEIVNCMIFQNRTGPYGWGGGIDITDTQATITNCVIQNNEATYGGGIYVDCAIVDNCLIRNNYALTAGGLYCFGTTFISGCTIIDNEARDNGGGVKISGNAALNNCIIVSNIAGENGGGIDCNDGYPVINCVIVGNIANSGKGGGMYTTYLGGYLDVVNCIIYQNFPDQISYDSRFLDVMYSNIEDGWPGESNIDENPKFVAPNEGDFRLKVDSPCIDAGDPTYEVPLGGGFRIDMGAYEYWQGWNIFKHNFAE